MSRSRAREHGEKTNQTLHTERVGLIKTFHTGETKRETRGARVSERVCAWSWSRRVIGLQYLQTLYFKLNISGDQPLRTLYTVWEADSAGISLTTSPVQAQAGGLTLAFMLASKLFLTRDNSTCNEEPVHLTSVKRRSSNLNLNST